MLTACKQYYLAAGATQGNIAYTQNVSCNYNRTHQKDTARENNKEKTEMRYLGNKTKLLNFIDSVIHKHEINGQVFLDLFAGTGSVGDHFKSKYTILANDFMYYSYILSSAKILNEEKPCFDNFRKKYSVDIFEWLNNKTFKPNEHYFICLSVSFPKIIPPILNRNL